MSSLKSRYSPADNQLVDKLITKWVSHKLSVRDFKVAPPPTSHFSRYKCHRVKKKIKLENHKCPQAILLYEKDTKRDSIIVCVEGE